MDLTAAQTCRGLASVHNLSHCLCTSGKFNLELVGICARGGQTHNNLSFFQSAHFLVVLRPQQSQTKTYHPVHRGSRARVVTSVVCDCIGLTFHWEILDSRIGRGAEHTNPTQQNVVPNNTCHSVDDYYMGISSFVYICLV